MKALVKKHAEQGLWLDDVPMPEMGNNDVLIKIKRTAICGTDVHIYNWDEWAQQTIPVPMTIGHEFAGEIVDLGANVTELKVGDNAAAIAWLAAAICAPTPSASVSTAPAASPSICRFPPKTSFGPTSAFPWMCWPVSIPMATRYIPPCRSTWSARMW